MTVVILGDYECCRDEGGSMRSALLTSYIGVRIDAMVQLAAIATTHQHHALALPLQLLATS